MDVTAGALFLVAFNAEWTGGTLHEWVGLTGIVVMVVHLLRHSKWLRGVGRRMLGSRLATQSLVRLLLAVGLFASLVTLLWSGLALSNSVAGVVGIGGGGGEGWKTVHETAANAAGILIIVHVILHQRWLRAVARQLGAAPESRT